MLDLEYPVRIVEGFRLPAEGYGSRDAGRLSLKLSLPVGLPNIINELVRELWLGRPCGFVTADRTIAGKVER